MAYRAKRPISGRCGTLTASGKRRALDSGDLEQPREPVFNAPWPLIVLTAAILGSYAAQSAFTGDAFVLRYGFAPASLQEGRFVPLLTALFLHGGWAHAIMNALGALAFGAPLVRLLGQGVRGAAAFFLFFLICGVLGNLGYALLHPQGIIPIIGASGGVSGLMGAASRLIDRRPGLAPFTSSTVVGMAVAWLVINLIVGVVGFAPGSGDSPVAWEAHVAGYAAGLLLVGPLARILRRA